MEILSHVIYLFEKKETNMIQFLLSYSKEVYLILFLLFFSETGIVFLSFLPGDSILLAVGTLCAGEAMNMLTSIIVIFFGIMFGAFLNYGFGYIIGKKAFTGHTKRFFNQENIEKTHGFYEKYGAITLILSRFFPIVRAFAPFIAGIGKMNFKLFTIFTLIGSLIWDAGLILTGMLFSRIPFFRKNMLFTITVIMAVAIIFFPLIIFLINLFNLRRRKS